MSVPSRQASASSGGMRRAARISANAVRTSRLPAAARVRATRPSIWLSTLIWPTVSRAPDVHLYTSIGIPLTSPEDGLYAAVMSLEDHQPAKPLEASQVPPKRLVKTWLPVDVVRRMDVAIVRSSGGYLDRAEFIAEAIRDRLAEEEAAASQASQAPVAATPPPPAADGEGEGSFADWLDAAPTLPPAEGPT